MCDFASWFGGGDDPAAAAALARAQADANKALLAQKQAQDQAKAASDSDSESAQLAREAQLRKLASAGAFGASFKGDYGAAPVATRQLFGSA